VATLAVTGPRDLLGRLPSQESVTVSIVASTAEENEDGTWSLTVYAAEDQVPALEALGYTVAVVTSDAALAARWLEIAVDDLGVA
jgi:hypothetical protein